MNDCRNIRIERWLLMAIKMIVVGILWFLSIPMEGMGVQGIQEVQGVQMVPSVPEDTTIHRMVKKTDYPTGGRAETYPFDLKDPENLKPDTAVYDDKIDGYRVGARLGDGFLSAPYIMSPLDYLKWTERSEMDRYFKVRNDSLVVRKGKEQFDFTDMHFDLGPAEKIFGPGGVRVRTTGSAELKFGYNYKYTDNPSLTERNRKQANFDFDEKINIGVKASVGDKMNFDINYNTDASFDFDSKKLKLSYEGKDDEIVKLLEAGNVDFPTNNSLVRGAKTLFGIRTDLQFGKLKLQTIVSQKKSQSTTVASKGGAQLSTFEIQAYDYDENRHFFLSHFFQKNYDTFCADLPTVTSGVTINRIEVWVTNTSGYTEDTRNIIGFVDLAEGYNDRLQQNRWYNGGAYVSQNASNSLYKTISDASNSNMRYMDQASNLLSDMNMAGGVDYEKIENARLLSSSEYTLNKYLGYISLKSTLQPNQVVAVAYEYTYGGKTYQVGEFSSDIKDNDKALYVKLLKNTTNSPAIKNWRLMMKNVYDLKATSVQKDKFKLDIKYLCDTTGVAMSFIPEGSFKQTTLLKMMNLDRLDDNNKTNPNGKYDYIEGYTVLGQSGKVIFPVAEPFGEWLESKLGADLADKYCYYELYDSTKTVAKRVAEKAKFSLEGEYKASGGSEIQLGAQNVPNGSVVVTAGGVTLTEGTDYTVNYSAGIVSIINQSIIDAGTNVSVSLESNDEYSTVRKTMLGVNWDYEFSKDLQFGGTFMRLTEKPLTTKVAMGAEPLNNTVWGLHVNWKKQSQWLTNLVDKLPFIDATEPSNINFKAEFAQLIAGKPQDVQGNASYIDDFESAKQPIDVKTPTAWMLSSTPSVLPNADKKNDLSYGYGRAKLAWYVIDPLFTRRSSSLTPSHIKSDLEQLSNHYVREVYVRELYPNKDTNQGESNTLDILNLAYYPDERGPYNFDTDVNQKGRLNNPQNRWGGMMRKLDTSDFETSNIQYVEFWMLDPFIYTKDSLEYAGKLVIDLGDVSEDVLKDGKKSFESGIPVSNAGSTSETVWGRVSNDKSVVYAFSTESNARTKQDVGLDGLSSADEAHFAPDSAYLATVRSKVSKEVYDSLFAKDPAADDYHYFRGDSLDLRKASILDRYKHINSPEGNSPNSTGTSFNEAYKTTPDVEDINQDYTMNEYENYYQYTVPIDPRTMTVGSGYIVDSRKTSVKLRNGKTEEAIWYQFRIPIESGTKVGTINDYSSIRFMRMYMTEFQKPIVLRFGSLDLVRGEWRTYNQALFTGDKPSSSGTIKTFAVNIEENNDKTPVNYVLPPGITREEDPSQPQLVQANEQSLAIQVENLAPGDARAVYKNTTLDLRKYKHVQMFVHANALENDQQLKNNQMSVFVRLGSDYKSNFYEYEIPLTLTPAGRYDTYTTTGCEAVWPEDNMLDLDLEVLTDVKRQRNKEGVSYTQTFSQYDSDKPNNKISVIGNPSLGEVKTMMIGIRNNGRELNSVEVWVDELRLQDYNNDGGWAAQGSMNVQLSDLGSVNVTGHIETAGYGGLEEGVSSRTDENLYEWGITTNVDLGKFFPDKWKMNLPLYYSYTWQKISPKYNPFDTDMLLKDALDASENSDSLSSITEKVTTTKNFSLSNWKSSWKHKTPLPIDPDNFSISYAHSKNYRRGQTTVYENNESWKGSLQYKYAPKYKTWEPFKNLKTKSKWADIIKAQNLNWLPQSVAFNTDISRTYYEYQERDVDAGTQLPVVSSSQFLWNRQLNVQWDIFKALKMSYTSSTHAEIEEPYIDNKNLYVDNFEAWKDSVTRSIFHFGRPLTYSSTFQGSYTVPLNKIPITDWMSADGSYNATYGWTRGAELANKKSLGNTAVTQRNITINGKLNMETLYKKIKFLDEANQRFSGSNSKTSTSKTSSTTSKARTNTKADPKAADKDAKASTAADTKKSKGFTKEITLNDSTYTDVKHSQNSKRIVVRGTTKEGKTYELKYKKIDANTIRIKNQDTIPVKVSVVAKAPINHDTPLYKTAQVLARGLMMIRNVSLSYRNTYSMSLPGFKTDIGDAFGQRSVGGVLSPGLDFALGAIDDSYLRKAADRGWLITGDSITTPATTNSTEDVQLRVTLEPVRDLKIDLNASRTVNKSQSIQFMYDDMPVTQSGSFTMTTMSLKSAFAKTGDINDNYDSKPFNEFLRNLPIIQRRIESKYENTIYPNGTGEGFAGQPFDAANGTVDMYSADVMIPAFLSAYCHGDASSCGLDIFPSLLKMLPNWTLSYSGLSKLPWFADHFKSFNINHGYKSVYAVGAYNSFTNYIAFMGDQGYVLDVTSGNPIPSSMYNVNTVSLNESFSPLIGVDMTFNSGMTGKVEYKKTRSLNLSMTSVALTENYSNDIVIGLGYKVKDLNLFGAKGLQDPSTKKKNQKNSKNSKDQTDSKSSSTTSKTRVGGVSHDLNLSCEFSYRLQNAINRNIQTNVSTGTQGSTAYNVKLRADYTFSRMLTMSGYIDWQKNVPLVSTNSYPTTTADFGVSMKFSLTRQ